MDLAAEVGCVVIDNGSSNMKFGFAGDNAPRSSFPTIVDHPNESPDTKSIGSREGDLHYHPIVEHHYPIQRGIVTNWEDMEFVWRKIFNELHVFLDPPPVLLSEDALNPKQNREKTTQIMFESLSVHSLYLATQQALAMYASGRGSGLVLNIGEGSASVVPVFEGYCVSHGIKKLDIGGADITDYLMKILNEQRGCGFSGPHDRNQVQKLKEKLGYVASNYTNELELAANTTDLTKHYEVTPGNTIEINSEPFQCTEILFQPSLFGLEQAGIHEMVHNAIQKCDESIQKILYGNILLAGGSTLFAGLADRLTNEISILAPNSRVNVIAPLERMNSTWIGGSILGSLSTLERFLITKAEYDEFGASIVHTKCK